jgi:hypothetical protein
MDTKKLLKTALKDVKKEWGWVLRESKPIKDLQKAIEKNDTKHFKRFERRAARYERRINRFEQKVIKIFNSLKLTFPAWTEILSDFERQTKIYNEVILKKVSLFTGTIPKLIKANNIPQLKIEVDEVMNKGVLPLDALLRDLEKRLKESYEKYTIAEKTQLDKHTEETLNKQPFLVIFHSVSERDLTEKILSLKGMPTNFLGRRIEYAFETDYFWVEHQSRMAEFFGHGAMITPGKGDLLLSMRYGTYKGPVQKQIYEKLYRKGLLLPRFVLPKVYQSGMKIMIEIKGGKGPMERALDDLVRRIKENGLENRVLFLAFSEKPLVFLKQRIPSALTVKIGFKCPSNPYVDIVQVPSYLPSSFLVSSIKKAAEKRKFLNGGALKKQKKFYLLVENGARGALIWHGPETVLKWLSHPEYAKATAKQNTMAVKPV